MSQALERMLTLEHFLADIRCAFEANRQAVGDRTVAAVRIARAADQLYVAQLDEPGATVWQRAVAVATLCAEAAIDGDARLDQCRLEPPR